MALRGRARQNAADARGPPAGKSLLSEAQEVRVEHDARRWISVIQYLRPGCGADSDINVRGKCRRAPSWSICGA